MATTSDIEWTDKTWNPVVGCKKVSPGCAHCYAEVMAKRLAAMAQTDIDAGKNPGRKRAYLEVIDDKGRWNGKAVCIPEALDDPLKWRKPAKVFVNSMSDLFHEDVPDRFIESVFCTMARCPQHTFQILTKRADRLPKWFATLDGVGLGYDGKARERGKLMISGIEHDWPLKNVWLGTSVENQQAADERIPELLKVPAAVRFLSMEPLLEEVSLRHAVPCGECGYRDSENGHGCFNGNECEDETWIREAGLHWVIVGGESGPGARPMDPEWARSIRDQCQAAGVPFFFKQRSGPRSGLPSGDPDLDRFKEYPNAK